MKAQHARKREEELIINRLFSGLVTLVILVAATSGCGVAEKIKDAIGFGMSSIDRTLRVLDNGIARMDNESADWQGILTDMTSQLTEDAQSTIRNEITQLMQESVEAISSNIKCIIDMTRSRLLGDLLRIRADLVGTEPPPIKPNICTAIPTAIDMGLPVNELNKLELYGFDLSSENGIRVFLINSDRTLEVTEYVDYPTHYMMTLNLGGMGVPIKENSQRIQINWNDDELSTVGIIQPHTPVCEIKTDQKQTPAAITYMPLQVAGDAEFGGHGPFVYVYVELLNQGTSIQAAVEMWAQETKSNWSTAYGTEFKDLIIPEQGWKIYSIDSPASDYIEYIDSNHDPDIFNGGGPVEIFTITGDGDGSDIGYHTKVDLTFNEILYSVIQTGDCLDPNAVVEAIGNNLVTVANTQRLFQLIPSQYWGTLSTDQLDAIRFQLQDVIPADILHNLILTPPGP